MSENDKKITQMLLANINEARMLVRSYSTSGDKFKPIKLKSLKEARLTKKTTITRTLSFPDDFSSYLKERNDNPAIKSIKNNLLEENQEKTILESEGNEKTDKIYKSENCKTGESKKKIKMNLKSDTRTSGREYIKDNYIRKQMKIKGKGNKNFEKKNKSGDEFCPNTPGKERKTIELSTIKKQPSFSNPIKPVNAIDGNEILEFMNSKNSSKKLTKNQEKGLIERLQGGYMFKFNNK